MKTQDSEILRRSSVFRFLSDEHFEAIEPFLQEEHYEFGDVIVKQGDPANSFYVLTRGRARALKIKPGGEEIPLGLLKPGALRGRHLFHEPPDRRHSTPARWCEAGSAICRPTGSWRIAGSSFSHRRSDFDGDVQSIAHPRVSGDNTALRGTNDFFGKSAASPVSRGGESQGKYSSHQIDAIKIEAVKAASAESAFRDAMLNEFLSVSQKLFKATFIVMSYDSVLQTIGLLSTAIFLWVGATQVIHGHLSVGGLSRSAH